METVIHFGVPAIGVALVSAALAWLLQRRKPRWHPVVIALVACVLVAAATILGLGIVIVRALMAIGEAGHADIDTGAAPAATIVLYGGMVITLLPFAGLPAALLTAFRGRRPPVGPA